MQIPVHEAAPVGFDALRRRDPGSCTTRGRQGLDSAFGTNPRFVVANLPYQYCYLYDGLLRPRDPGGP